jgi:hypothetical protein
LCSSPPDPPWLQGALVGVFKRLRCAGHFCIDGLMAFAFAVGVGNIVRFLTASGN